SDPSLLVDKKILSFLHAYDKKTTLVLVDPAGWQFPKIFYFLKIDGWNVESLIDAQGSRMAQVTAERLQEQVPAMLKQHWSSVPNSHVIALIGPRSLQLFVADASYSSCQSCVMFGPVEGGLYTVMQKVPYYIFEMSPTQNKEA